MQEELVSTDYLVVGAGATAMAFVDTLLTEDPVAKIVMVDRHDRPGGHWLHAYPFVRLHQPAVWYGVASRELASRTIDQVGFNAGYYSLASGAEVLAHFDGVLRQRVLPSGRVRFLPMSEATFGEDGAWRAHSLTGGASWRFAIGRKVVDGTHARTEVPSTHPPKYQTAQGVSCIPVNDLPRVSRPYACYTVVGSGKTGIDACIWLMENGVEPERIRWIMPRDAWLLDRRNFQPGLENFETNVGATLKQCDAIVAARDLPDLLARLEAGGALLRLDPEVEPSAFRCAIVSAGELAALRRIHEIVRKGRLRRIEAKRLVLERGEVPAIADTLYIDCSALGIQPAPSVPVFEGDRINLLFVRICQPVFSAALIAWVESHVSDAARKNALCTPVPPPEVPADWLRMWAATLANIARWRTEPALHAWLSQCRLYRDALTRGVAPDDMERMNLAKRVAERTSAAVAALPRLLASLEAPSGVATQAPEWSSSTRSASARPQWGSRSGSKGHSKVQEQA